MDFQYFSKKKCVYEDKKGLIAPGLKTYKKDADNITLERNLSISLYEQQHCQWLIREKFTVTEA